MDPARKSKLTRHLLNREKTFFLINSGDKLMRVPWGGETIVVPGSKHITPPHRKFSDVRHSVILNLPGEGDTLVPTLIPGTLIVKDIIQIGDVEDRYVKWDAAVFIFEKIGQDFDGEYGRRGLSWAPPDASLEELTALAVEGRERWEEASIRDAQMIMYEQQVKESKWMQHNMAPPPPPTYVLDAKALLEEAARRRKKAMEEMFIQGDPYAKMMVSVTGEETEIQEQSHEGVAFGLSLLPMDEKTTKKRA